MEYKTLQNGMKLPVLGLGVYNLAQYDIEKFFIKAIKTGYTYFDYFQSSIYEPYIRAAINKSEISRESLILSTTLNNRNFQYDKCYKSIQDTLSRLETDYLDIVLVNNTGDNYLETWSAVEDCYKKGYVKAIGTSSFYTSQLKELYEKATVKPMLNQLSVHPYKQVYEQKLFMDQNNIALATSLQLKDADDCIFSSYKLNDICAKYKKNPVQIINKWMLLKGCIVLASNVSKDNLEATLDIFDFELDQNDLLKISEFNKEIKKYFTTEDYTIVESLGRYIEQELIRFN